MTVIHPNSISGIASVTSHSNSLYFYESDHSTKLTINAHVNGNVTGDITATNGTFSGDVTVGGTLTYDDVTNIDSVGVITARAGVKVPDSQKIFLGTDDDLQIYHTGGHGFIRNTTGQLSIRDDSEVNITDLSAGYIFKGTAGGSVELYHNTSKKFETTSAGIKVSGSFPDIIIHDTDTTNDNFRILHNGGGTQLQVDPNNVGPNASHFIIGIDGTERLRITSNGDLMTGGITSGAGKVQVGGGLRIAGSATHTDTPSPYLYRTSGADNLCISTSALERLRITSAGLLLLGTTTEGHVSADDFTVAGSGDSGITIRSGSGSEGSIMFSDATSGSGEYVGWINYNHNSNFMRFFTNATERLRIASNGTITAGPQYDQIKIEPGNGTYDTEATTLSVDGRTNNGNRIAFKVDRYGSGTSADTKFSINYAGLVNIGGAQFTTNTTPSSGRGVEIFEAGTGVGQIASFNRDGNGWDELRIKGSEVKLYAGTTNTLTLNLQSTQSTLYGTSDGILNLDTTDQRGAFIRFKENGSTKGWAGCSEGLGTGGNQDDFGIRAIRDLRVKTGSSNTMRLTAAGYLQVASDGDVTGDNENIFRQHQTTYNVLQLRAETSSYAASGGGALAVGVIRSGSSSYVFGGFYSGNNSSNFQDRKFSFRGDGQGYADGAWNGGGADYAEYFEWSDGNTSSEDRRGISVVLDGDKIREATSGEDPIGVISANPSVVGDADDLQWKNKYLRTEYGSFDLDENGEQKLNPDYNPNQEYVSRENRPEWDCVGLMGKLRIRKGQVTGSRWIKMRDVSVNVEEWLVR